MLSLVIAGSRTVDPPLEVVGIAVQLLMERHYAGAFAELAAASTGEFVWGTMIGEVVCGDADGGDLAGDRWGSCRGITVHHEPITPEDIARHGKYKGPRMRNRRMADRGDCLVAFWDGTSGGTADMVCRMVARQKPLLVVPTKPTQRPRRRARSLDRALTPR